MRTRVWARRPAVYAAALALTAILPACGGGGGNGPTTPPVTQPPAPVRSLLFQGSFNLVSVSAANQAGFPVDALRQEFTLSAAGTLEVNADWTFAGSQMAIGVLRGACSFAQIFADSCSEAGGVFPSAKPTRLTINNLAAGTYTFVILNVNNYTESGNYQVYLTR